MGARARRRAGIAGLVVLAALALGLARLTRPPGAALDPTPSVGAPAPPPPPAPGSLLARALTAHGGVERWQRVTGMRVRLRFGGLVFRMRLAEPEPVERLLELDFRTPGAVLHDYPGLGRRGVFRPERVWIESADGRELRALEHPRQTLLASRRRQLWWDDLDLLYFASYALWNYLQGPFLFLRDGVETREIGPWQEGGETWQRLAVRFHDAVPTHSREQVFYFGPDFRLRRQDYRPEVYAAWAEPAHLASDYRAFDGLWLPTRRLVVPRRDDGTAAEGPRLVWIEVADVELQERPP